MHPFATEAAAILVHSLNRFSLCTKMAAVAVANLLLCRDIICKCSIGTQPPTGPQESAFTVHVKGLRESRVRICVRALEVVTVG